MGSGASAQLAQEHSVTPEQAVEYKASYVEFRQKSFSNEDTMKQVAKKHPEVLNIIEETDEALLLNVLSELDPGSQPNDLETGDLKQHMRREGKPLSPLTTHNARPSKSMIRISSYTPLLQKAMRRKSTSYTPIQKDIDEKKIEEVVELFHEFIVKAKSKRAALCVAPKGLTMAERMSHNSKRIISELARRRWLFAIHKVLKQQQIKQMAARWQEIDIKWLARDGYCQPQLYFSGSRLFLKGEERMFIDVSLYLHASIEMPCGVKRVKSVIEVVCTNFKAGVILNRIYIDYDALHAYLSVDVDLLVSGAVSFNAIHTRMKVLSDTIIANGRKTKTPVVMGDYILKKLGAESATPSVVNPFVEAVDISCKRNAGGNGSGSGDIGGGGGGEDRREKTVVNTANTPTVPTVYTKDTSVRMVLRSPHFGDHYEKAQHPIHKAPLSPSRQKHHTPVIEINRMDLPTLRPVIFPYRGLRRHSDHSYSTFTTLVSEGDADRAIIKRDREVAEKAVATAAALIDGQQGILLLLQE